MSDPWRGRVMALIGVALLALNLRIAVAVMSPIADAIDADIPLTHGHWEALSVAPPLCFAIFGALAPRLARRFGLEALLVGALALTLVGEIARSMADSPFSLLAWTIPTMAGAGIGNVICPPVIKKYFPDRIGLVTGVYTGGVALSTAIPPLFVTQLQSAFGWRPAVGVWALITLAAIVPWLFVLFDSHRAGRRLDAVKRRLSLRTIVDLAPKLTTSLWRTGMAWALTGVFFVNSIVAYAMFAWLPDVLRSAGLSALSAAHNLALFALASLPGSLIVPILVARIKRWLWVLPIIFFTGYVIGFTGLALSPAHGTVIWILLTRMGDCFFPYCLTMINLRTRTHEAATALSGFVQSVGYTIASAGPWAFGALFAVLGRWDLPIFALMALLPIQAGSAIWAARHPPINQ